MTTRSSRNDTSGCHKERMSVDELLLESIILLDPPPLAASSSELSLEDVRKAHEYLLMACQVIASNSCKNDDDNDASFSGSKNSISEDWIRIVCDVYRGMILCTHLLLEMDPSSSGTNSSRHLRNIRKCILLLYHLALMHQQQQQREGMIESLSSVLPAFVDWNGQGLPFSPHGILQECFQTIPLTILNTNSNFSNHQNSNGESCNDNFISFGSQPPLISLQYRQYLHHDNLPSSADATTD